LGARLGAGGFGCCAVSLVVGVLDGCLREGFAAARGADLSAADGDFFVERGTDSGREEVLPAGRFLFSGMRLKIITSLAGCDQL